MGVHAVTEQYMEAVVARSPGQPEFHQAVLELLESVATLIEQRPEYREARIVERLTEPDRTVIFRVVWEDDRGELHTERGYRVQFNSALGPYKGGLRLHPSVNLSVLKFLGFEQTFKNALTGLPMGGGKGGATFDPHRRSDREVMRFCQSFMTELYRHIGENTDVPAGDIGVGGREIGFLWGQYKRLANRVAGVITGKGIGYGGSQIRTEATGYGAVYFAENMLAHVGESLDGMACLVSGSGNVALYTVEKLLDVGAKAVTLSDSGGTLHVPGGITVELLHELKHFKEVRRGRLAEYADRPGMEYLAGATPWHIPADGAFPSATENELHADDAMALAGNGCRIVVEGANMPTTLKATQVLQEAGVRFAPGKAANAGGVAVSGLEQSQNAQRLRWSAEEVDRRLRAIMSDIHDQCVHHGALQDGRVDYVLGAKRAGFLRVADAILAQGVS